MAKMMVISFAGMFTADMTSSMVTRPADGIDAAPIEATVAVKLLASAFDTPPRLRVALPDNNQLAYAQLPAHQLREEHRRHCFVQRRAV